MDPNALHDQIKTSPPMAKDQDDYQHERERCAFYGGNPYEDDLEPAEDSLH